MAASGIALLAVFFAGIAYWPNVISRAGLRFPLYPLFVAPTLYYLLRGLRTRNRNDFILGGLFLGLGLHGYSPFRIMPIVVVIIFGLYLLHAQLEGYPQNRPSSGCLILAIMSLIVFPAPGALLVGQPRNVDGALFHPPWLGWKQPLPGPAWQIFLSNTWNAAAHVQLG